MHHPSLQADIEHDPVVASLRAMLVLSGVVGIALAVLAAFGPWFGLPVLLAGTLAASMFMPGARSEEVATRCVDRQDSQRT